MPNLLVNVQRDLGQPHRLAQITLLAVDDRHVGAGHGLVGGRHDYNCLRVVARSKCDSPAVRQGCIPDWGRWAGLSLAKPDLPETRLYNKGTSFAPNTGCTRLLEGY